MTLRRQIAMTLAPLLILLMLLGAAGFVLLSRLGSRIDVILRENYDSVLYMERLGEELERIDSSFQFAIAGRVEQARAQYEAHWKLYPSYLRAEQGNVTIPGEQELVDRLTALSDDYRRAGDAFFALKTEPDRNSAYFGDKNDPGLYGRFQQIKEVAGAILRLNQENMENASRDAKRTAASSLIYFSVGLLVAAVLAVATAIHTARAIVQPIHAITESALAIGAGNLDQVVSVTPGDELSRLGEAFNTMARQLRDFRRSQQDRMLRLQKTSEATISAFPHPVLVIDTQGQVEMANPAARRVLSIALDVTSQRNAVSWQPPEVLRQPLADALRHQRDHLPEGFEHTLSLRQGNEDVVYLPRVLTIRDEYGQTLGAAVLLEDVTRFRLLDQIKSNLVATVSHELKTPLTGIQLAVHVLLEEVVGPLAPKQLELLLDARDNADRLLAMINNLLDLARLEEPDRHLLIRAHAPQAILQEAADYVRPRAEDKGVEILLEVPPDLPAVAADGDQLGHALGNLVDNALRHTEQGGRITLAATLVGDRVRLTIADTGRGIPPEYLPHLFERFFRVPGQSTQAGTGLGLAIVHDIISSMHGSVSVASQVARGTTFTLNLPLWSAGDGSIVPS